MHELKYRLGLSSKSPDIIAITETKPKNSRHPITEPEIHIAGFETYHSNLSNVKGRGICVYVRSGLQATELATDNRFDEHTTLMIRLKGGDNLLLSVIYRSPNSNSENNNHLLDHFDHINSLNATHILIMGDFNYPNINWTTGDVTGPEGNPAQHLLDKIQECFWSQKVDQPTRKRGQDLPSLLDLVITNNEDHIEEIIYESPRQQ